VKYIYTPNRGAGAARNSGINIATRKLIAFCDSDDEWMPGKVEIQRAFMQSKPDVLFCFSNFSFREIEELGGRSQHFVLSSWPGEMKPWDEILDSGHRISAIIPLPEGMKDFNYYVGNIYLAAMTALYTNVNTLIVRKEEAADALHFAEDTPTFEEWECFGRLAAVGKCAYLDFESACQHSHGGERLTNAHITECAQARVTILPRVWGSDNLFLQDHYELYQRILTEERLTLVDGLLVRGETAKARHELKLMASQRLLTRNLLAAFPGTITKNLLSLRRLIKSRL